MNLQLSNTITGIDHISFNDLLRRLLENDLGAHRPGQSNNCGGTDEEPPWNPWRKTTTAKTPPELIPNTSFFV